MRKLHAMHNSLRFIILCTGLGLLVALPLASSARLSTSVNIVNNSSHVIRHVYLSHVDVDDWTADQLTNGATIGVGQTSMLSNLACDQQQVKVIAEDQDGCFLTTIVNCSESATWTITNDTARDCGTN